MFCRSLAAGLLVALSAVLPATAQDKLPVVATFSILGDFVSEVGGERVTLTTLVDTDGDTHVYSATPADAKALASARLVFVNGLGFEGWIDRLVKASGSTAPLVTVTRGIKSARTADDHGHDHGDGHSLGERDPHAWQSVANAKIYVANIRDALSKDDPAGKSVYEANANSYLEKLDALDREIRAAIGAIPERRRRVITSHDAFAYFEAAYGIDFIYKNNRRGFFLGLFEEVAHP